MKLIKNSAYRSTWVPDHCNDLGPLIYSADTWQESLFHNVLRITPSRRRVAIDAGANVGLTTIALRQYFDHVYAFEADPLNYECLVKNTEFLDNVTCINSAISNVEGKELNFARTLGVSGHTRVNKTGIKPGAQELFKVTTTTLDSHSYPGNVDFIKMDVEGMEYLALHGSSQILTDNRPAILLEIDKGHILKFDAIYQLLRTKKYIFIDKLKRDFLFIAEERYKDADKYFALQKTDTYMTLVRNK